MKGFIQSIKTSPWHLVIRLRFEGTTRYLFIPRGGKYKDLLLSKVDLSTKVRCSDKLREKVKNFLLNSFLRSVKLSKCNINLEVIKAGETKFLNLTYGGGRVHVGYYWQNEAYLPYRQNSKEKISQEVNTFILSEIKSIRSLYSANFLPEIISIDDYDKYINYEKIIGKKENQIQQKYFKKKKAIEDDIRRLRDAVDLQASLIDGSLVVPSDLQELHFKSIKLNLRRVDGQYKKINYIFEKCKAYKSAVRTQEARLHSLENGKNYKLNLKALLIHQVTGRLAEPKTTSEKNIGIIKIFSDGHIFKLGKNKEENIIIRQSWAKKTDYWFHLENEASGHGFLRLRAGSLTHELLELVGQEFCQLMNKSEVNLIYTQVKYLRSLKGDKGKVVPTQIKYFKYRV